MYIVRDKDNSLWLFKFKPRKCFVNWKPSEHCEPFMELDEDLFPKIKWEDEEPTEVELVIKKKV